MIKMFVWNVDGRFCFFINEIILFVFIINKIVNELRWKLIL